MMTIRTFLALEIPDGPLQQILDIRNNNLDHSQNIKWEPREKLHVTLKFLGDTNSEDINDIIISLESVFKESRNFQLSFSEFGFFMKGDESKILWIGIDQSDMLNKLVEDVESGLSKFGFRKESRRFKPHITLLRIKNKKDACSVKHFTGLKPPLIKFTAEKLSFYESMLLPRGSVYKSIKYFYLKN